MIVKLNPTRAAIGALEEAARLRRDGYRLTGWPALAIMGVRAVHGGLTDNAVPCFSQRICEFCTLHKTRRCKYYGGDKGG